VGDLSRFLFLGAVSCAVASAFFWMLARQAGDKTLARMTAVAAIGSCVAAFLLGSMLF
jgi:putative flippase GtrA